MPETAWQSNVASESLSTKEDSDPCLFIGAGLAKHKSCFDGGPSLSRRAPMEVVWLEAASLTTALWISPSVVPSFPDRQFWFENSHANLAAMMRSGRYLPACIRLAQSVRTTTSDRQDSPAVSGSLTPVSCDTVRLEPVKHNFVPPRCSPRSGRRA